MFGRIMLVVAIAVGPAVLTPALAQADTSLGAGATTWKTISLGTFKSKFAMFDALDAAEIHIGDLASQALH